MLTKILSCLLTLLVNCQIVLAQQGFPKEQWVPASPIFIVPEQLSVSNCKGTVTVEAGWVFRDGGYRVIQPQVLSRNGQTISLDAQVERTTGVITLSIVPFKKSFDIGPLEPGTYTLDFKSWGSILKQIEFTIYGPQPSVDEIDDRCFFVAKHYTDFLGREADNNGLGFWTNEIASCGMDAACIEEKRINVSAAFLFSIEFKSVGYYVYRTYRTAFGRAPTFVEFIPDAAVVGRNLVVGSVDPWQTILHGNKSSYAASVFNRPEFQARYGGLTSAQYVDKLFATQGVTPSASDRAELINSLDHCTIQFGCPQRWNVLRTIVEHPQFDRKIFNEAFVTLEYFGYLRRDPDPEGFQFWLNKLNQFNGNFVKAEMVKAFLRSDEYRRRF
jgi:hypothetical protein